MPQANAVEAYSPSTLGASPIAVDSLILGGSTLSSSVTAGATSITLTASISGLGLGSPLTITDGVNTEVVVVVSTSSAPTYTLAAACANAHASGVAVTLTVNSQAIGILDPANPSRRATLDPNNNLLINPGVNPNTSSASLTAVNGAVTITLSGEGYAAATIYGTYSLSFIPEYTPDGITWLSAPYNAISAAAPQQSYYGSLAATNISYMIVIFAPGALQVRIRCSAFTSGSATAVLRAQVSMPPWSGNVQQVNNANTLNTTISNSSGALSTIATNGTLAAATFSTTVTLGYANTATLFFQATAASTGTVSIFLSGEGTYFGAWSTTIAQSAAATTMILQLPPVRYIKLQSTVALTAFTANVTASY